MQRLAVIAVVLAVAAPARAESASDAFDRVVDAVTATHGACAPEGCHSVLIRRWKHPRVELRSAFVDGVSYDLLLVRHGATWSASPLLDLEAHDCGAGHCIDRIIVGATLRRHGRGFRVTVHMEEEHTCLACDPMSTTTVSRYDVVVECAPSAGCTQR